MNVVGTLALLGNVIGWAATPVLLKLLVDHVDAWTANGLRYPLSAFCFTPLLVLAARSGRLDSRVLKRALVPAFFSLGGQVFWALSPYYLSPEMMTFLIKASIVWALLASMLLFPGERRLLRSRFFYAGLILAGGGFLALSWSQGALDDSVTGTGVVIMAACAIFFGFYGVSVRWCLRGVPSLLAFGVVSHYVAFGAVILMLLFGRYDVVPSLGGEVWACLLGSSLLGIAIGHVLFYVAIQRLGPTLSTSAHLAGPFITLALANVVLGTTFRSHEWIAGSAMVGGGALLVFAQRALVGNRKGRVLDASAHTAKPGSENDS